MTMDKHSRTSIPAVTPYKKARKPLISKSESKRQKLSFKRYNVGGGDDCA